MLDKNYLDTNLHYIRPSASWDASCAYGGGSNFTKTVTDTVLLPYGKTVSVRSRSKVKPPIRSDGSSISWEDVEKGLELGCVPLQ